MKKQKTDILENTICAKNELIRMGVSKTTIAVSKGTAKFIEKTFNDVLEMRKDIDKEYYKIHSSNPNILTMDIKIIYLVELVNGNILMN